MMTLDTLEMLYQQSRDMEETASMRLLTKPEHIRVVDCIGDLNHALGVAIQNRNQQTKRTAFT